MLAITVEGSFWFLPRILTFIRMRSSKSSSNDPLRCWAISLEEGAAHQLAMRSRGTPRIANRLLRRVRDWAIVHDLETVHPDDVKEALALYQIDTEGLDRLDIAVLKAIVTNFNGGPVGLNNLSAMVGEESETVETVCEPYLVREGFLVRTPKGACGDAQGMGSSRLDF